MSRQPRRTDWLSPALAAAGLGPYVAVILATGLGAMLVVLVCG